MQLQAAPAPYSRSKGAGVALLLGSLGWLAADDGMAAAATASLGAALLAHGWAKAPFASLTIADMWPDPSSTPAHDPQSPAARNDPQAHTEHSGAEERAGTITAETPSEHSGADDMTYVRRTGATARGGRSPIPSVLALLHKELSVPLRLRQWRRNRPEQP